MHTLSPEQFAHWTRRLRDGDQAALAELFRAVYPGLLRYARTVTSDSAQAEDAVQEALLAVWQRRAGLDPERSLRSLLLTSVRNRLLNTARDTARRQHLLEGMPEPASPETPEDETDAELLGHRLRAWIDELPDRRREAFTLSRFEGLSYAEIADLMECSVKTVEHQVGHALRHLRDRLRDHAPDALRLS